MTPSRLRSDATVRESLPEVVMPACPIQKVLEGQKVLVTGANSGIGRGIAIAMAHAGADVVVNYFAGDEAAEEVVRLASTCGTRVFAHRADVSDESQVRAMFERMLAELGTIDVLVNNAGIQRDAAFEDMTLYPGFEAGG